MKRLDLFFAAALAVLATFVSIEVVATRKTTAAHIVDAAGASAIPIAKGRFMISFPRRG